MKIKSLKILSFENRKSSKNLNTKKYFVYRFLANPNKGIGVIAVAIGKSDGKNMQSQKPEIDPRNRE